MIKLFLLLLAMFAGASTAVLHAGEPVLSASKTVEELRLEMSLILPVPGKDKDMQLKVLCKVTNLSPTRSVYYRCPNVTAEGLTLGLVSSTGEVIPYTKLGRSLFDYEASATKNVTIELEPGKSREHTFTPTDIFDLGKKQIPDKLVLRWEQHLETRKLLVLNLKELEVALSIKDLMPN
ncbi:hypothetical protein DB346_15755 [Verrucomicrobia bacterium LW23]|nr:hypothetical protein DB346_15755 [Verrucomicrobia bacterium LW23]